jgi:hypothetical protein
MSDRSLPGIQPSSSGPARLWMWLVGGAMLILIVVAFASCQSGDRDNAGDEAGDEGGDSKYVQTWATSYSETTCADWLGEMTSGQRWAAAADILTSARNKIDGGEGLPPDSLITEFEGGLTNVCIEPTMTLTDASYGLYTTEPRFHP